MGDGAAEGGQAQLQGDEEDFEGDGTVDIHLPEMELAGDSLPGEPHQGGNDSLGELRNALKHVVQAVPPPRVTPR